ncbi:branched-chain amino acid ABC transporter permease [Desulforhabdus amnigena]|jgi:branched-chain amino acid transport system permease protein|uniref:Branched-chain amino acid ABC transporter permease n=1 Tax=Desulforhabdus amnigena TaxID=40218 RepID=A0A9W6FRT5_9BACT|nr:branched-chain amino acid ABC transporter permease [Desulforhabdus amnigena]NLJ28356.1 branched-chain amino acid ABC transporter permease [Deltaproteobacteria bacterium]GLI33363.1 branched-chain amino acid ABC transporter permease [Desulforhabdus amnigena]
MIIHQKKVLIVLGIGAAAILPLFLNAYWVDVLNSIGIYAILGLSLNLIVGHAGLFNLGHAAFYAVGAYTAAILNTHFHIPVLWLIPLSAFTAGVFALIIARPIIHLRGDYLCIVTIGVGEIVRIALINNVFGITGGANGIFGISRPSIFGFVLRTPYHFFYLILAFTIITIFLFLFLENSRFGRALNYLKEDEVAAEGSGINTAHYKLASFVLGASWAGMMGNIYAAKMTIISPESFTFWESVLMFAIVILGGSGSIPGVLLGALLIVGLPEVFREFATARMLIFGAAMVAMMIFRTQGLLPSRPRSYSLSDVSGGEGKL